MVVADLNVVRVAVTPPETDAPLIVDSDAVLPSTVASEPLETVSRWYTKVFQRLRGIQNQQLPVGSSLYVRWQPPTPLPLEDSTGLGIIEAPDHGPDLNVFRYYRQALLARRDLTGARIGRAGATP
jgi:hypothetical protein